MGSFSLRADMVRSSSVAILGFTPHRPMQDSLNALSNFSLYPCSAALPWRRGHMFVRSSVSAADETDPPIQSHPAKSLCGRIISLTLCFVRNGTRDEEGRMSWCHRVSSRRMDAPDWSRSYRSIQRLPAREAISHYRSRLHVSFGVSCPARTSRY